MKNNDDPLFIVLMNDGEFYCCGEATDKKSAAEEATKEFPDFEVSSVYIQI